MSWRETRDKDGRHSGVSPPCLARRWFECALCAVAGPGGRVAPRDAAPSLPHMQGPPLPLCTSMHATVPTLAILFSGLVSTCLTPLHFQTSCHWHQPLGIGTITGHQGCHKPGGPMSAPNAGHSRPDMSGPAMANFIVDQKNIEIGRPRFQLPIAPSSSRAPQLENGKARSRVESPSPRTRPRRLSSCRRSQTT